MRLGETVPAKSGSETGGGVLSEKHMEINETVK
jgi:hypothetical protein